MSFLTLFEVASMPILQVLLISALGAFMATEYFNNILSAETRRSLNKIVFMVFTPALMFASLSKTVTLHDIISWWYMPINVGLTFAIGGILGWIIVKLLKPDSRLEGLIIATCSTGNLGNLPIIIVPAMCDEGGSPFGERNACHSVGTAYASFSMALGSIFVWTFTYQLMLSSSLKFKALKAAAEEQEEEVIKTPTTPKTPNKDLDADLETNLLRGEENRSFAIVVSSPKYVEDTGNQVIVTRGSSITLDQGKTSFSHKLVEFLKQILEELFAPPTAAAFLGFTFGAITWLRNLIIGENAPLHVIQDSIQLLGNGAIPCLNLLLGGNLTQGLRSSAVKPFIIVSVIVARYIFLPAIGFFVVRAAGDLGFLPSDPLFQYVLMIQYSVPPAMNISTMTQLFDVGQEECSVLLLWTYLAASLALTAWSTFFLYMLV
ncbi:Auxin efflux carrier family protein [Quillaja saponaria]|uniref:Auxin efflux carrier family protein n=1 Tax=Quillaja saponaria TaxID=32244 RepID=A0AAD7L7V8_QUISA|nr:Auxin efflux carrier family protein [Quillaja saponaria]